jgi:hypothetical protein
MLHFRLNSPSTVLTTISALRASCADCHLDCSAWNAPLLSKFRKGSSDEASSYVLQQ